MKSTLKALTLGIILTSCCNQDLTKCNFQVGDDVRIKHKLTHNTGTLTDVSCGCKYTVEYFTYGGFRRYRYGMIDGQLEGL